MAKKIKKAAPKKATVKKTTKSAIRTSKKVAVKKTVVKKSPAKKSVEKETITKKAAPVNKTNRPTPVKKSPAKKTVSKKAAVKRASSRAGAATGTRGMTGQSQPVKTATITVTFSDVAAGNSLIKATLIGGKELQLTSSGTMVFNNIKSFDIISINGTSPGSTKVAIDVAAQPDVIECDFGGFHDNFLIL